MQHDDPRPVVILLAEDDPGDQELVKRALTDSKLHNELRIVSDGQEALDYLLQKGTYAEGSTAPRPDLLLLDLNMPKIDGRTLLKRIRSEPEIRRIPVVILTTSKQESDILQAYDLGANSYIVKPVTMDGFVQVVSTLEEYWFQIVVLPENPR